MIQPAVLVIMETEIWPNLINSAKKKSVPVIMINTRISDRSFKRYLMAKPLLRPTFKKIDLFCAQSDEDAARVISIGAQSDKVRVTGNMKFDISLAGPPVNARDCRSALNLEDKDILIVAGSTHKGEEEILISAYRSLSGEFKNIKLLIAPRHINRAAQIRQLMKNAPGVFLLDTIGRLKCFYAAAEIVFVGGSLIPHGGQNPIEPAYFSKPIIFGPYMNNFKVAAQILLKSGAAMQVNNAAELESALVLMLRDPKKARAMGFFANKSIEENKGASGRNFELIKKFCEGAK